jgi:hypothetical protein
VSTPHIEKRREEARLANQTSFQGSNSTGKYTPHNEEEGGGEAGQPNIIPGVKQYRQLVSTPHIMKRREEARLANQTSFQGVKQYRYR